MARSRLSWCLIAVVIGGAVPASGLHAQDWFTDLSLDQSFSSAEPYKSPRGFTASLGAIALLGPFGFHVTYDNVTDAGGEIDVVCTADLVPCVPGTLSRSYRMRTAGIGVSYDFINPTDVMLTLALTGTKSWHTERMERLGTGDRSQNDLMANLGFAASAHLRLRPVLGGIRPVFAVHYDHGGRGGCAADTPCWGARNAFGASVGFGWVLRAPRGH